MRFSKKRFLKNAPARIKRQLKEALDVIDGMEVIFDGKHGVGGYIPRYFINEEEYYLYPVEEEWCEGD